jgi:hypothetical protein
MKWVLITGAGASRELGRERPLPLMADWAANLCDELNSRESNFAEAAAPAGTGQVGRGLVFSDLA